ncbi:hypothetical protein OH799_13500 [Nocardia sp. NBC_00881]|uniref:hypothetical protein n=1 Tax=Nocardia sp. NBC_00881 TaxID=2975995 RepID=UPI003869A5C2|nr:hypothetical protein OH799_13500 [Nocardia sp. NBC_00881]
MDRAIAFALFLYGIGVGLATAQVTNVVLADVPADRAGQGAGIQSTARELGSALGIAALTTLLFSVLDTGLRDRLGGTAEAGRMSESITDSAGSAIPALAADPSTALVGGDEHRSGDVQLRLYRPAAPGAGNHRVHSPGTLRRCPGSGPPQLTSTAASGTWR